MQSMPAAARREPSQPPPSPHPHGMQSAPPHSSPRARIQLPPPPQLLPALGFPARPHGQGEPAGLLLRYALPMAPISASTASGRRMPRPYMAVLRGLPGGPTARGSRPPAPIAVGAQLAAGSAGANGTGGEEWPPGSAQRPSQPRIEVGAVGGNAGTARAAPPAQLC